MTTLDAKIRLSAQFDAALTALRSLKTEILNVQAAGSRPAGGATPFKPVADGAEAAQQRVDALLHDTERLNVALVDQHGRPFRPLIDAASTVIRHVDQARRSVDNLNTAAAKTSTVAAERVKRVGRESAEVVNAGAKAQQTVQATAEATAKSLRQTEHQMRMLGPQVTDIVVGLTTGQSPLMVLLQQGGQLRDIFGGVGNAVRAITSLFTPLRVAVGAVAAVFGGLATAAYQGYKESDRLNKSLALTGNIADTSLHQVNQLARSISDEQNAAIGGVRRTLEILVSTGRYTSSALESTARAVTALRRLTGQSADEALEAFEEQAEGITAWATKANRAYNFLSAEQLRYIRTLESEGRTQEAIRFANEQLATTLEQRAVPAVGLLERAWVGVGKALSGVWDTLKGIGRDTTPEERIAALQERLAAAEELRRRMRERGQVAPAASAELRAAQAELDQLLRQRNADQVRASEQAIRLREEQDRIRKDSKAYQDALAQIDLAGARTLQRQLEARLEAERAAIERAHADGLTSAEQNAQALNAIDQRRLAAQQAYVRRAIEIERGRVTEKPEDVLAKQARIAELDGELAELAVRIQAAADQGRSIVARQALADAREQASAWAQVWQQAYTQIRALAQQNAAAAAQRLAAPMERARAEADAATAELRQKVADLQRDLELRLSLTVDEGQRAELKRQLQELAREGQEAIDGQTRAAMFASLQQQYSEMLARLENEEAAVNARVQAGTLSRLEAERQIFALRAAQLPDLERQAELLRQIAGGLGPDERNRADGVANQVAGMRNLQTEMEKTARSSGAQSLSNLFTDLATRSKSAKEAFGDMVSSFGKRMLDLINQRLGEQLLESLFPSGAAGAGGGGWMAGLGQAFASLFHTGGIVGSTNGSGVRAVSPLAWLGAPRYHTSGIVGLKPRERAIIAMDGEEVLDEENPRHIKNFRRNAAGVTVDMDIHIQAGQSAGAGAQAAAADLGAAVEAACDAWALKQSRPGGLLYSG